MAKKPSESRRMKRVQERHLCNNYTRDTKKFLKYLRDNDKELYQLMKGEY